MKIVDDQTYTTRIFQVEDGEVTYTATYSEDLIFCKWEVVDEEDEVVNIHSDLGISLIKLCEDVMYPNQSNK